MSLCEYANKCDWYKTELEILELIETTKSKKSPDYHEKNQRLEAKCNHNHIACPEREKYKGKN